jgi:predicted GIY-YIG superfamily endonuclease
MPLPIPCPPHQSPGRVGVIYLLHFARRYRHAAHYTGWASDLEHRLAEHAAGRGARLLAVIEDAGIAWTLARTWEGTRSDERALKRQGGASRRCPLCGVTPQTTRPSRARSAATTS